jgi:hypothetical protein
MPQRMSGTVYPTAEREALMQRAKELRAEGYGWNRISRTMGIPHTTLMRWLCPEIADRQRAAAREAKRRRTGTCRGCGATTRYNGHAGIAISEWCLSCRGRQNTKWTREAIFHAIREWTSEHGGRPPSAENWNPHLARANGAYERAQAFEDDDRWPYSSTVIERFGSWNEAIRQAGFTPRRPGQRGRTRCGP